MTGRTVVVLIAILTFSLWAGPAKGAVPTIEELRKLTVTGPLDPPTRQKMVQYIDHWVGQMKSAKEVKDVVKARLALTDGYNAQASSYWQTEYAGKSAARLPSILSLPDVVKQLQASIALVGMPQYAIQPALEKMARHENPAVRYWAARGYGAAARRVLLYGDRAKQMRATLERLGAKESGPILAVVLRTLALYYPNTRRDVVAQLRVVLDKTWLARCRDIQACKVQVIEAYRKTVVLLAPADEEDKKRILQLLVDAMEAASRALAKARCQKDPAGRALMALLGDLEAKMAKMAEITSTEQTPIRKILGQERAAVAEKAAQVRLTVNEYWKPLLAAKGVKTRVKALTAANTATRSAATTTAPAGK